ncbi:MAG: lysoplasmalogenase [Cyclobacteriaceae bacterium]|nr:lysoplasmalogenase [Cyclobacteriaceae bacterium]
MKKISLIFFGAVSGGELFSALYDFPLLHTICKPALLITLLGYYFFSLREQNERPSPVLMMALIFSWGGDVLLMGSGELYFMLGLASFLTAHVFYIFTFRQFCDEDDTNALRGVQRLRFAFPIILYGTGLVVILYPHLGELTVSVLLYALVLTVMVLNALFRFGRTVTPSFVMVFGGAILFMISDSLLAVNKFIEPVTLSGFWILSTYICAQFLIVSGLLKYR